MSVVILPPATAFDPTAPGAIGGTTPAAITGTTITATVAFGAPTTSGSTLGVYRTADPTTGIQFGSDNSIVFYCAGTAVLYLYSSSFYIPRGSAGTPALGFIGEAGSDTGFYSSGAGHVGLSADGVSQIDCSVSGTLFGAPANLKNYIVADLPASPSIGATAFVTDANATVILGLGLTVVGGGANKVPVYYDGTWKIG